MKFLIYCFLIILSVVHVYGQPEKGQCLISGSMNFRKVGSGEGSTTYSISPNFGFFVSKKTVVGLSLGYERSYLIDTFLGRYDQLNTFLLGLYSLNYFSIDNNGKFFFTLNSKFGFIQTTYLNKSQTTTALGVSPGFSFFPTRKVSIDFLIGGLSYVFPASGTSGQLIINGNLQSTGIGISFLVGRTHEEHSEN